MTPQILLDHFDNGRFWPESTRFPAKVDVPGAYQKALAVRELRVHRGEVPRGFKIGFTNRQIWALYNVFAPIWGTVWNTTIAFCEGQGTVSLDGTCEPRLEPETVFGMKATPVAPATLDDLFDALDWVAPGFEVVQSHRPGWKFTAAETVADGGLHARLLVGPRIPVPDIARNAAALDRCLAEARVTLLKDGEVVDRGTGAHVLDSPLRALHHFVQEIRSCPGAPDLQPHDVVTTGTWTDAWPIQAGDLWRAEFTPPLSSLSLTVR